jgi:hypothetical protein
VKALSIHQPFAWLIVSGIKPVENRSWNARYRGPLLIHASRRLHSVSVDEIERHYGVSINMDALEFGGIVGRVELADVVTTHPSKWFQGPYGFVLKNPVQLPFRPYRGRQMFFEVP